MFEKIVLFISNINNLVVIIFTYISILIFCFLSRSVEVQVNYAPVNHISPDGLTTLYFDNGDNFEEEDSVYKVINQSTVCYSFQPITPVKKICLMPTRIREQIVYLQSISFSVDGSVIGVLEGNHLYNAIVQESSSALVEYDNQLVKVQYAESSDWAQVILAPSVAKLTNHIPVKTLGKALAYCFILLIPCIIIRIIPENVRKADLFLIALVLIWFFSNKFSIAVCILLWLFPFIFVGKNHSGSRTVGIVCISILGLILSQIILVFSHSTIINANSAPMGH